MIKYKKIKKNDNVKVISGKNVGKSGRVINVDRIKGKVLIEGVNLVKKAMRKTRENQNGGIKEIEAYLNLSNVMLVCPKCKASTRVAFSVAENKKTRICKKCKAEID